MMSRVVVGVAIGVDSIAATWRVRGRALGWKASLARDGGDALSVDVLGSAFGDMGAMLPSGARVRLAIAIMPPLVRVRRVELPRMRDDDRRLAVARAAERHFVGLGEPVVCAVERRKPSGAVVPFLAAAVSSGFVSDLEQVAGENGWMIDRFVPAHAAWLVAAKKQCPELRRGDGRVSVPGTTETTVLIVRGGELTVVRRFRSNEVLPENGPPPTSLGHAGRSPAQIAAAAAPFTRSLQLLPDSARRVRFNAQARATRHLFGAAAACVVAAGGVHRWGLSRHLDIIVQQRSALHARASAAVAARETLDHLTRSVDAIQSLERRSPHWSATIARIAVALPRDASLIALRADGDSVSLDGQARNAAAVFAALRSVPGIVDVHLTAPIRQELTVGQRSIERWTLAFRIDRK